MSNKYTPNGISFLQIKKYAKRLKKESSFSNQQALDQETKENTSFESWNELIEYDKNRGNSFNKIKIKDLSFVVYNDKPLIPFYFEIGLNQKTILPIKMFHIFKKVLIITPKRIKIRWEKDILDLGIKNTTVTSFFLMKNIDISYFDCVFFDEDFPNKSFFNKIDSIISNNKNVVYFLNQPYLEYNKITPILLKHIDKTHLKRKKTMTFDLESQPLEINYHQNDFLNFFKDIKTKNIKTKIFTNQKSKKEQIKNNYKKNF